MVVTLLRDDAIAGTGNRHLRRLKGRVVRRGKRTVGRKAGESRVVKVSLNNRSKVIKLLLARGVRLDVLRV